MYGDSLSHCKFQPHQWEKWIKKKYVVNWFEHLYRDMDFYKHWGLRNLSWNKSTTFGDYVSRYGFCKVLELGNPPLYRYKPSIVDHN